MTVDQYELILKENNRRIYILKNYYEKCNWLNEYDIYRDEYISFTSPLIKRISFTNSHIRKYNLNDDTIPNGKYFLSKLRIDYYNGYLGELNNTTTVFDVLNKTDYNNGDRVYFFTVDYTISNEFFNVVSYLKKMKDIYKNLVHTKLFRLITGLIIKYEVSYSLYNGLLYYIPHNHLLIKTNVKDSSALLSSLFQYFHKYIPNTDDKAIHYKEITYNSYSYKSISKYITKDPYYSIFHYKDRSKNIDTFIVPQPHIVSLLYGINSFHFYNSYKDLKFRQFYR